MIFLISPKDMQYDICGGVTYISKKSKYLKTEMKYATAIKTNTYIHSKVLSNKKVSFKLTFSFHVLFNCRLVSTRLPPCSPQIQAVGRSYTKQIWILVHLI